MLFSDRRIQRKWTLWSGYLLMSCLTTGVGGSQADPLNPELHATLKMVSAHATLISDEVLNPDSASNRAMIETLMRRTLSNPSAAPDQPLIRPSARIGIPGSLQGKFSVNNKGGGSYRVTLPIPKGRDGLRPSLSISYSSGVGTGVMGEGFYFATGYHSSISRGRSIQARDDEARGIELGERDKFYLDGKRLLCVSEPATHGQPGSIYRTEVDSFANIQALGSKSSIETFILQDKDGETYTFGRIGESVDGLHCGYDEESGRLDTVPAEYALKRIEDRLGNYITLSYDHKGFGEWVLSEIDYTGRSNFSPQYIIRFFYGIKPAPAVRFSARRRFDERQLLEAIRIFTFENEALVAEYLPVYAPLEEDGIHRLQSITGSFSPDIGEPLQRLPSTLFHWTQGPKKDRQWRVFALPHEPGTTDRNGVHLWGDFDGDGRVDLMTFGKAVSVRLSRKEGFGDQMRVWLDTEKIQRELQQAGVQCAQLGDVDGDGLADLLITGANGRLVCWRSTGRSFELLTSLDCVNLIRSSVSGEPPSTNLEEVSLSMPNRVRTGDFNGDGRTDIMIHGVDGHLHQFLSRGTTFVAITTTHEEASSANPIRLQAPTLLLGSRLEDINGDGNDDYVWLAPAPPTKLDSQSTSPVGVRGHSNLYYALALPEGGFSNPVLLHEWHGNRALYIGEFNRDGLPDFLIGEHTNDDRWIWSVLLNRGHPASSTGPAKLFFRCIAPVLNDIADTSAIITSDEKTPRSMLGNYVLPQPLVTTPDFDLLCLDTNDDGMDDIIWRPTPKSHAPEKQISGNSTGWSVCLASGDGAFQPSAPLCGNAWKQILMQPSSKAISVMHQHDINGDGLLEWITTNRESDASEGWLSTISGAGDHQTAYPQSKLVRGVTDGLGRTLDIAYRAAKDEAVYTPGSPVKFPIRDMRTNRSVVSDIWHDTGGPIYSQYSYHYAGNRLDFSGRGGLGFNSMTTFDHQTGFCKLQFLAQAFPMTGLIAREQTYRTWQKGSKILMEMITSTDNTVVYDAVVDPFTERLHGTVYSYISRSSKSTWNNDGRPSFSYRANAAPSKSPLFTGEFPIPPTWIETTDHWFDRQNQQQSAQLSIPAIDIPTVLSPRPPTLSEASRPIGALPGKITFGNETENSARHLFGFFKRENKTYLPPTGPTDTLTGLIDTKISSEYLSKNAGVIHRPVSKYQYFKNTALLSIEQHHIRDADGTTSGQVKETHYTHDPFGRLTARYDLEVTSDAKEGKGIRKRQYLAAEFNNDTDLPARETDPENGEQLIQHNLLFRKPSKIFFGSGTEAHISYDGFGRTVQIDYPALPHQIRTQFEWSDESASDWSQPQSIPPPGGTKGVIGHSVYAVRKTETGNSSSTEYHDRMDRIIRIVNEKPDGAIRNTDTVYDDLDRVLGVSEPYTLGDTITWKINSYDVYGNVIKETSIKTPSKKH